MNQFFKDLPPWAKGTIAVISLGSMVLLGIAIRNAIVNRKENKGDREADKELDEVTSEELTVLSNQGISPTLSDADAFSLSNIIASGLDGCELSGTEKDIVNQILSKVNNKADWVKLQNVFGRRVIDNCGYLTGDTMYELKSLLLQQLDGLDFSFKRYSTLLINGLLSKGIEF